MEHVHSAAGDPRTYPDPALGLCVSGQRHSPALCLSHVPLKGVARRPWLRDGTRGGATHGWKSYSKPLDCSPTNSCVDPPACLLQRLLFTCHPGSKSPWDV